MKLVLFDIDEALVDAWRRDFYGEFVEIHHASLEGLCKGEAACDGLVSPANSFGIMDGGIDLPIRNLLPEVQENVTTAIAAEYNGYLPMGTALYVPTDAPEPLPSILIVAPTMPYPMPISPFAIYNVMRAVLACAEIYCDRLACCGLGTLTGKVDVERASEAMALAFRHHNEGRKCEEWADANPIVRDIIRLSRAT